LLIRLLYDQRAKEAGVIVLVLATGTWFLALEITNGSALLALGRPKWVAAASTAKLAGMTLLIPLGMSLYGFRGAVVGFAASEVFRYVVSALGALKSGLRVYKQDLILTLAVAMTTLLGLFTSRMARRFVEKLIGPSARIGTLIQGAVVFTAFSVAWAVVFAVHQLRKRSAKSLALV
jgi:O-antigen/teichoic acid export membrane protein